MSRKKIGLKIIVAWTMYPGLPDDVRTLTIVYPGGVEREYRAEWPFRVASQLFKLYDRRNSDITIVWLAGRIYRKDLSEIISELTNWTQESGE